MITRPKEWKTHTEVETTLAEYFLRIEIQQIDGDGQPLDLLTPHDAAYWALIENALYGLWHRAKEHYAYQVAHERGEYTGGEPLRLREPWVKDLPPSVAAEFGLENEKMGDDPGK